MMLAPEETNVKAAAIHAPAVEDAAKSNKVSLSDEESLNGDASGAATSSASKNLGPKVLVPGPADVLLGRGKPFQSHQGNQLMLQLVDQFRANYLKADRKGKHIIIEHVLNFIKERGGRFLVRVDYENYWVEVKRSVSYRKVGHAFRSKARRPKKVTMPLSPGATMMKGLSPNLMGNPQGLDMDSMMGLNQARAAKLNQMMGGSTVSATNPLLRLPARLPATNQGLSSNANNNLLKEIFAMDRMGAQQDALAMRRQLQGMGAGNFGAFNNNPSSALLNPSTSSMDELFLLERMQGMSQAGTRAQGVLNTQGLLSGNPFGMLNGAQGRFSNQML